MSYTIGDLEIMSGIKAHTIRIWEKRYGLIVPSRSEGNTRYYNDSELVRLMNVALLNKNGIKISHIVGMDQAARRRKALELSNMLTDNESAVDSFMHAAVTYDQNRLFRYVNSVIDEKGIEQAFMNVIFPFIRKIGVLWVINKIIPAQEHLFTNICKQKLFAAVDALETNDEGERIVLFLPEWDLHELALLFYHYVLTKNGYHTVYLGQVVTLVDVAKAIEITGATKAISTFIGPQNREEVESFLTKLLDQNKNTSFYLSGPQIPVEMSRTNLTIFKSFPELKNVLHLQ